MQSAAVLLVQCTHLTLTVFLTSLLPPKRPIKHPINLHISSTNTGLSEYTVNANQRTTMLILLYIQSSYTLHPSPSCLWLTCCVHPQIEKHIYLQKCLNKCLNKQRILNCTNCGKHVQKKIAIRVRLLQTNGAKAAVIKTVDLEEPN